MPSTLGWYVNCIKRSGADKLKAFFGRKMMKNNGHALQELQLGGKYLPLRHEIAALN